MRRDPDAPTVNKRQYVALIALFNIGAVSYGWVPEVEWLKAMLNVKHVRNTFGALKNHGWVERHVMRVSEGPMVLWQITREGKMELRRYEGANRARLAERPECPAAIKRLGL